MTARTLSRGPSASGSVPPPVARRLERILFALAGAIFGATVAAFVEARTVVFDSGTRVSTWSVAIAEGGVLFPLALVIGLGVSIASLYLEPAGPVSFSVRVADVRRQPVLARSRIAALAPLVCLASTVWLVGIAHLARSYSIVCRLKKQPKNYLIRLLLTTSML